MFFAGLLVASALASGPPPKLLIELGDDELLRRVPELTGVRFDRDVALVRSVLQPAFQSVNQSFDKFADLSAAEQISEVRLELGGASTRSQTEHFRYVAAMRQDSLEVRELRLSEKNGNGANAKAGGNGFVAGDRFIALMELLLPEFEGHLRTRTIGRTGDAVVFAFAVDPGAASGESSPLHAIVGPSLTQGVVWVDAKRAQPVRLLCDVMLTDQDAAEQRRVDITFATVRFDALNATLLLPVHVTFDVSQGPVRAHSVHRFSDFRLYGRGDANDPEAAKKNVGVFAAVPMEKDALERLSEGVAAMDGGNHAAAITALREAVRLDASLSPAHYHLARALRASSDAAAAEAEARLALKGMGGISAAHNLLGILLIERGAAADALPELRESVGLAPGDATAHGNLARALDMTGDRTGALAEVRRAVELAPANQVLQAQLERMSAPAQRSGPKPEETIRVDVREVQVPAVVFDKPGHTVGDLKQSDFRVLEDGVEQTITSFRVETSGEANLPPASNTPSTKPVSSAPPAAAATGPRHTYLIVIDALHSRLGNLGAAREALRKFFASERPGDSQYGVISVGQTTTIVQNMTRDPAVALAALDDKAFLKIASGSRGESAASGEREFEQNLARVRALLDTGGSRLASEELRLLSNEAQMMEAVERNTTVAFLSALRSLVRELAKGKEHRTLILISDGFSLSPGHNVRQLLVAYLGGQPPAMREAELRSVERVQAEFESVVKVAARANVIIDTIDSRGLYTDASSDVSMSGAPASVGASVAAKHSSLQMEAGMALGEFAAATGGTVYQNSNDLFAGIRKAVAEGRDYYTLGYVPSNSAMDGHFRNITVEVKGRKLTLRAKRGYWATAN